MRLDAQVIAQFARTRGMTQFTQCFRFDLTNALARHPEKLPDFFQRVIVPVNQAEAHLQHLALALA